MTTKQKMLRAVADLPEHASIEDAMERLLFLAKVERGIQQADAGQTVPQYIVDKDQKRKAVLVSTDEWEQIVGELEELDDIRAYDAAQSHAADKIPFEQAVREIEQDYKA